MIETLGKAVKTGYGNRWDGWARFTPAASPDLQVLKDSFGIRSITRLADGRWRVQLAERPSSFVAHVDVVENDTTNLHEVRIEAYDYANGTFDFVHRTAAYGSLGSLALSNTVDELWVSVDGRIALG